MFISFLYHHKFTESWVFGVYQSIALIPPDAQIVPSLASQCKLLHTHSGTLWQDSSHLWLHLCFLLWHDNPGSTGTSPRPSTISFFYINCKSLLLVRNNTRRHNLVTRVLIKLFIALRPQLENRNFVSKRNKPCILADYFQFKFQITRLLPSVFLTCVFTSL